MIAGRSLCFLNVFLCGHYPWMAPQRRSDPHPPCVERGDSSKKLRDTGNSIKVVVNLELEDLHMYIEIVPGFSILSGFETRWFSSFKQMSQPRLDENTATSFLHSRPPISINRQVHNHELLSSELFETICYVCGL